MDLDGFKGRCALVLVAMWGSGCGLFGDESCPAVDGYSRSLVDPQDVPETVATLESIAFGAWFVETDGELADSDFEVESLGAIVEVERGYCGDTSNAGYTAEATIVLDVADRFTLTLAGSASVDADGATGIGLIPGIVQTDLDDAAAYLGLPADVVALDAEVKVDCGEPSISFRVRTIAASCEGQSNCPITSVVPLGKMGIPFSPRLGDEDAGPCG